MTIEVGVSGASKLVPDIRVGVGGQWKVVADVRIGVGGVWKPLYTALEASATDVSESADGFAASGPVTTPPTNLTVTYGSGNYSYNWSVVSYSGTLPTVVSASSQNPYWSGTVPEGIHVSTWKVVVTDNTYGTTAEDEITVSLQWVNTT